MTLTINKKLEGKAKTLAFRIKEARLMAKLLQADVEGMVYIMVMHSVNRNKEYLIKTWQSDCYDPLVADFIYEEIEPEIEKFLAKNQLVRNNLFELLPKSFDMFKFAKNAYYDQTLKLLDD